MNFIYREETNATFFFNNFEIYLDLTLLKLKVVSSKSKQATLLIECKDRTRFFVFSFFLDYESIQPIEKVPDEKVPFSFKCG